MILSEPHTIPDTIKARRAKLNDLTLCLANLFPDEFQCGYPIGSGLIAGCSPKDLDLWVLAADRDAFVVALKERFGTGVRTCGNDYLGCKGSIHAVRLGAFNLIITDDMGHFGRGITAQQLCEAMRETNKATRVLIFDVIRECIPPAEARQRWLNNIDMGVE